MVKQSIHQCAVSISRSWMHCEPSRFIQHDDVLILKEHIKIHRLGLQVRQWLRRGHPQLHLITIAEWCFGLSLFSIDPHIASINEFLNPSTALLRALAHQPAIQSHRKRLRVSERHQLPLAFPKRVRKHFLWQRRSSLALFRRRQRSRSSGNSKAMLPKADLRKSSKSRCAMRAVSFEVCRAAAASSQ